MKIMTTTLLSSCLALAAGGAFAQSTSTANSATQSGTINTQMTLQQCKNFMETHTMKNNGTLVNKDGSTMDMSAMTEQQRMCYDMMSQRNDMTTHPASPGGMGQEPGAMGTPK